MDRRWIDKVVADDSEQSEAVAQEIERIAARVDEIVAEERLAIIEAIDEEIKANKDALMEAVLYYLASTRLQAKVDLVALMAQIDALDTIVKTLEAVRADLVDGGGDEG